MRRASVRRVVRAGSAVAVPSRRISRVPSPAGSETHSQAAGSSGVASTAAAAAAASASGQSTATVATPCGTGCSRSTTSASTASVP